jgi:flagellar biosynthesis/type III secretory pathway M-ring protein FliF/YscJ
MTPLSSKKRWEDLTQRQQIAIIVMGVVQIGLLVAALVDIHQRSEEELTASKRTWTMISLINYLGPIAYFLFGRKE